jgi:hypothetical protein
MVYLQAEVVKLLPYLLLLQLVPVADANLMEDVL